MRGPYIGLWSLLAFQAGCINSLGFLACGRFVSHVTGFGTQGGISIGNHQYGYALELFSAPLFFIFGSWLNSFLTVVRQSKGLAPRYDIVTLLMPLIIFLLMIFGVSGYFGEFGGSISFSQDVEILSSLTFLCGMQNGCFATLTKGQIRTTHLTGLSTDIGTDFALLFHGNLNSEERDLARRRNMTRIFTLSAFSLGASISAIFDSYLKYWSLMIPFITSLIVATIFFQVSTELDIEN